MGQYQRLFLIADPAMRHSQALQRAAALAEASGAALHITAFVEPFATFALLERDVRSPTAHREAETAKAHRG